MTVLNDTPGSDRETTSSIDSAVIRGLVDHLSTATFFADNNAGVGRTGGYILLLGLRSGAELRLTWWDDGKTPNLRDLGQQEWWVVTGLESIIRPLLPNRTNDDFTVLVSVARRDVPRSEPIKDATVRVKALGYEQMTDQNGMAKPMAVALKSKDGFPFQIEVLKKGYQTCIIEFGSMVFPRTADWWAHNAANPARLFVYLPDGDGVVTGNECYGGRTQPQTPGPDK